MVSSNSISTSKNNWQSESPKTTTKVLFLARTSQNEAFTSNVDMVLRLSILSTRRSSKNFHRCPTQTSKLRWPNQISSHMLIYSSNFNLRGNSPFEKIKFSSSMGNPLNHSMLMLNNRRSKSKYITTKTKIIFWSALAIDSPTMSCIYSKMMKIWLLMRLLIRSWKERRKGQFQSGSMISFRCLL